MSNGRHLTRGKINYYNHPVIEVLLLRRKKSESRISRVYFVTIEIVVTIKDNFPNYWKIEKI